MKSMENVSRLIKSHRSSKQNWYLKLCRSFQQDTKHIWKKDQTLKTFLKLISASSERELDKYILLPK